MAGPSRAQDRAAELRLAGASHQELPDQSTASLRLLLAFFAAVSFAPAGPTAHEKYPTIADFYC